IDDTCTVIGIETKLENGIFFV
ncbi:hypothetical protein D049_2197B, partial [Vibrio parahaemolyticus VPTS-2010]